MRLAPAFVLLAGLLPTAPAAADGSVSYCLTARFAWSAETHPVGFPDNPHFSRLIGAAHSSRYSLFADGDTASSGLGLVATNGRVGVLEAEFAEGARRKRVGEVFRTDGLATGVGSLSVKITASEKHSQVSFTTMLAPSPDWFTGVSSLALKDGESWRDEVSVPMWVWDAGIDDGESYDAPNAPIQPRQSIRLAAGPQFLGVTGLFPIGEAVLKRTSGDEACP